tara:strand:- start:1989 stop:2633 length:645 start_codon:yes stop_codon:yes gene_type:complete
MKYLPKKHSENYGGMILSGGCFEGSGVNCKVNDPYILVDSFSKAKDYFNSPCDLLQGFVSWMNRDSEIKAYNQHNRLYSARYKYRFFRVKWEHLFELWDKEPSVGDYYKISLEDCEELTEEQFIRDMNNSMGDICSYVGADIHNLPTSRVKQEATEVSVTFNDECWCFTDSFLNGAPKDSITVSVLVDVEILLSQALDYISNNVLQKDYKFCLS